MPAITTYTVQGLRLLDRLLPRVTYKPNFTLTLQSGSGVDFLIVECRVLDSADFDHTVLVCHRFAVPPMADAWDQDETMRWIAFVLTQLEVHELREFLKLDGIRTDPPLHGTGNDEDPYR